MSGPASPRLLALVVVGAVASAAVGSAATFAGATPAADTPTPGSTAAYRTAPVVRGDLVTTTTVSGTVGFGATTDLVGRVAGTVTALPATGTVVAEGEPLYEVDARPVVRLDGAVPAWRTLGPGVSDGVDVHQLEQSLADLGFASGVTVDDDWTAATTRAVYRWQKALGVPVTGTVALGSVVFTPDDVRVVAQRAALGSEVGPGTPVLTTGGTDRVVAVSLRTGQAGLVPVGATVHLTLADGTLADGTVATAEVVAGEDAPSLAVTITAGTDDGDDDPLAGQLEGAPVQVELAQTVATDVLSVPVTALVALADGGYAVQQVASDGTAPSVPVTPGAFAGTDVELRGDDVAEGDEVVVTP
ncbi:peptidoglycan-binding protein [Cellulomonas palmilytica]|uniref:peptidoglycan-binding protein n=1 Tax=Cellulomonas palmilytica TaxID=2608402 RepID=UPI001F1850AF|nr:peptidoglycan-binding domain-containing protein [Cellulomonas palmilytica]UJP40187.1 peptidoglycan-binding protein [Cellulomonas palmilytica]